MSLDLFLKVLYFSLKTHRIVYTKNYNVMFFYSTESVYKVDGDDNKFYGVFTTSTTGLMGSAICTFTLEDIEKAFNGKFKEQATSSSAWLPVLTNKVPEPRPGQCVNDTETLPGN